VFARNGVDGSSIRAIAKEAGCDPSLLYYHFLNKEAIFVAILERKFASFVPDLESVADAYSAQMRGGVQKTARNANDHTPLQEALWQTILVFHRHLKDDAGFRGLIRGNLDSGQAFAQSELLKYVSHMIRTIRKYLDEGVESGELRGDVNLNAATFFFIRTSVDILDFFPMFATKLMLMPLDEAIDLAKRQWFQLFWAGMLNASRRMAVEETQPPQGPPTGKKARRKPDSEAMASGARLNGVTPSSVELGVSSSTKRSGAVASGARQSASPSSGAKKRGKPPSSSSTKRKDSPPTGTSRRVRPTKPTKLTKPAKPAKAKP
jgi:AcrR family transcriptional regulator